MSTQLSEFVDKLMSNYALLRGDSSHDATCKSLEEFLAHFSSLSPLVTHLRSYPQNGTEQQRWRQYPVHSRLGILAAADLRAVQFHHTHFVEPILSQIASAQSSQTVSRSTQQSVNVSSPQIGNVLSLSSVSQSVIPAQGMEISQWQQQQEMPSAGVKLMASAHVEVNPSPPQTPIALHSASGVSSSPQAILASASSSLVKVGEIVGRSDQNIRSILGKLGELRKRRYARQQSEDKFFDESSAMVSSITRTATEGPVLEAKTSLIQTDPVADIISATQPMKITITPSPEPIRPHAIRPLLFDMTGFPSSPPPRRENPASLTPPD